MARRTLIDIDNKILDATIAIGAEIGADNVTAQKVAARCDISHFTCFEHFDTKANMVDKAFEKATSALYAAVHEARGEETSVRVIWNIVLDVLISEREKTLFVFDYGCTYREKVQAWILSKCEDPSFFAACTEWQNLDKGYKAIRLHTVLILAFQYSRLVIDGSIPNTPENRVFLEKTAFQGIAS